MSRRVRLLSLLMKSGEFSRSHAAAQAIHHGHVHVEGKVVTDPKHSVKMRALVTFKGKRLRPRPATYIILNKPAGLVCQKSSREKTIYDILATIPDIDEKTKKTLFCVGRLDKDAEGLLVVTNDGQLEKQLTRKENHVLKTYAVTTKDPIHDSDLAALCQGVEITDEDSGKVFSVKALKTSRKGPNQAEIGIEEGRKRQIKKMLQAVGNEVVALKRVGIGDLRLERVGFKGKPYLVVSKRYLKLPTNSA